MELLILFANCVKTTTNGLQVPSDSHWELGVHRSERNVTGKGLCVCAIPVKPLKELKMPPPTRRTIHGLSGEILGLVLMQPSDYFQVASLSSVIHCSLCATFFSELMQPA